MIKLDDRKFCAAFVSSDYKELSIFVVNNYYQEKIRIRHYNIKVFNLYLFIIKHELNLSLYKGFISMAFSYHNSSTFGSLIIFN